MIVNSDRTALYTTIAGAASTVPTTTRQTGNWMAELERAFIAEQSQQQEAQNQNDNPGILANSASDGSLSNDMLSQNQDQTEPQIQSGAPQQSQTQEETQLQSSAPTQMQTQGEAQSQFVSSKQDEIENGMGKAFNQLSDNVAANVSNATAAKEAVGSPTTAGSSHAVLASIGGKTSASAKAAQSVTRSSSAKVKSDASHSGLAAHSAAVAATLGEPVAPGLGAVMQQVKQYQAMTASAQAMVAAPGIDRVLLSVQLSMQMPDTPAVQPKASATSEDMPLGQTLEGSPESNSTSSTEPYPLKQMHLFQGADGVHAWIRDAALSQPQAYSVAQALSSELQNSGLKLNALVLNGKKVAGLFQGNQYREQETFSIDQQQTDDVVPFTVAANQGVDEKGAN